MLSNIQWNNHLLGPYSTPTAIPLTFEALYMLIITPLPSWEPLFVLFLPFLILSLFLYSLDYYNDSHCLPLLPCPISRTMAPLEIGPFCSSWSLSLYLLLFLMFTSLALNWYRLPWRLSVNQISPVPKWQAGRPQSTTCSQFHPALGRVLLGTEPNINSLMEKGDKSSTCLIIVVY